MESRSNAIAAGAFVIALTVGLALTVLWLTRENVDRLRYVVVSKVAVTGLRLRAAVQLRGVDVGRVAKIAFDRADPRTVLIDVDVDRAVGLTRGTYGQLNFQGVTGLSYVELDDDGSDPRPLATSAEEPGRIELRLSLLDQLGGAGKSLLLDASAAVKRINRLLSDDNLDRMSGALHGVDAAAAKIAALAADLQPAARSLQGLEADTDRAMTHLDGLAADLRGVAQDVDRRLVAVDQIGQGTKEIGDASRALESRLDGDTLPRLSAALDDLARASRGLDRFVQDMSERPQSLIFGRSSPPGPGEPGFAAPGRGN